MTKKQTVAPIVDLNADDFNQIRMNVRASLIGREVPAETVNQLMSAYRTLQPIFAAATKYYKDNSTDNKAKAYEAANKAADYLLGKNVPSSPF